MRVQKAFGLVVGFKYTYLYCITHDGLMILDNKVDVLMMGSEHQGLRANASSDVDNQGTLREAIPSVP